MWNGAAPTLNRSPTRTRRMPRCRSGLSGAAPSTRTDVVPVAPHSSAIPYRNSDDAKKKNVPEPLRGIYGYGDIWTWTAICADSKLVVAYHIGLRDEEDANEFTYDLRQRIVNRPQLTSDGHTSYRSAIANAFGLNVDFAQLEKEYGVEDLGKSAAHRYSPAKCIGVTKTVRTGNPNPDHISTSYVERQNLTMRMSMRRFTRLTNGFSKKVANHEHAISLYFMYYNFCRVHQTLRVTPAMEAGLSDHVWEIEEIIRLLA